MPFAGGFLRQVLERRWQSRSQNQALETRAIVNRCLDEGLEVRFADEAYKLFPTANRHFQIGLDIYLTSQLAHRGLADLGSFARMSMAYRRLIRQMAAEFLKLQPIHKAYYLHCGSVLDHPARRTSIVCSEPFLHFLDDFARYVKNLPPQAEEEMHDARGPRAALLLSTNYTVWNSAREMWNALSDEQREPYRFRACVGMLFPASIDRALLTRKMRVELDEQRNIRQPTATIGSGSRGSSGSGKVGRGAVKRRVSRRPSGKRPGRIAPLVRTPRKMVMRRTKRRVTRRC